MWENWCLLIRLYFWSLERTRKFWRFCALPRCWLTQGWGVAWRPCFVRGYFPYVSYHGGLTGLCLGGQFRLLKRLWHIVLLNQTRLKVIGGHELARFFVHLYGNLSLRRRYDFNDRLWCHRCHNLSLGMDLLDDGLVTQLGIERVVKHDLTLL